MTFLVLEAKSNFNGLFTIKRIIYQVWNARSNLEGFITHSRFEPIFIILAIGFALLSNSAVSMNAPDEHVAEGVALSNATANAENKTAEPPGYQDRAATVPCFGYCSGLVGLLLAYSLISLRR
ncbi:MAG: hypothetical protein PHQ34_15540 [Methanothrix sp.]|nr:hypothetical protein [Methanothrix sp.]